MVLSVYELGGPKSHPVLLNGANYIFISFGINKHILGCFEYTVLLMDLLEGVSSVAFIIAAQEETRAYY